jgi:plasmid maintenance system antidote protein VapI
MNKLEILKPIHPGDILKTEFLEANNISIEQLATGTKLGQNT